TPSSTTTAMPSGTPTKTATSRPDGTQVPTAPPQLTAGITFLYIRNSEPSPMADGWLRLVGTVDGTQGDGSLAEQLLSDSFSIRVGDRCASYDMLLPITGCVARATGNIVSRERDPIRLLVTYVPYRRREGHWTMRLFASGLPNTLNRPAASDSNPLAGPVT